MIKQSEIEGLCGVFMDKSGGASFLNREEAEEKLREFGEEIKYVPLFAGNIFIACPDRSLVSTQDGRKMLVDEFVAFPVDVDGYGCMVECLQELIFRINARLSCFPTGVACIPCYDVTNQG